MDRDPKRDERLEGLASDGTPARLVGESPSDGAGVEPVNNTRDLAFDGKARKLSLQSAIGGVKAGAVLFGLVEMCMSSLPSAIMVSLDRVRPEGVWEAMAGRCPAGRWSLCAPMGLE